jgi:4'-phosphopantetheinyl transferase
MLKLYLAKINQDLCKHKISLALKKEIKQYQNKNAQLQKIASYLLLNRVLELNNIKSVRIKTNKYGKPYVLGNPIYFNISHNQKNVICGISDKPIGVDIETINPRIKTISKVLLSPNEQKTYIRASNTKLTQI